MTEEELRRDLQKFSDYLAANGMETLCGMFTVEGCDGTRKTMTVGAPDWIAWSIATAHLASMGYEVGRTKEGVEA